MPKPKKRASAGSKLRSKKSLKAPLKDKKPRRGQAVPNSHVPPRSEIAGAYKWNAESMFADDAAWEKEYSAIADALPDAGKYQSHLSDSPGQLADALEAYEDLTRRVLLVIVYAGMHHQTDTTDQIAAGMWGKAQGLYGRALAAFAFIEPELITLGHENLREWMREEPRLQQYAFFFDNLFRKQAHVRTAEVEELLGMLADPFGGASTTHGVLTNADFHFRPARGANRKTVDVTQGTMSDILYSPDRELRRTAWESYTDKYLEFKSTAANTLLTSVKQNVFAMHARRFNSTLAMSLFENNVPLEVFHNLIETFRKNIPTWHRYWRLRRKALGVKTLQPYDIWAPLANETRTISYAEAVEWICDGLKPMGQAYVDLVRRGCLKDRWVDIYPNLGKTQGAFSWGSPGSHPFIVMSYNDNINSLSTLAHELGHSMHSYYAWETQPFIYSNYSLFAAEVASNFHQAMVRSHLLNIVNDRVLLISIIEEAMSNFHRYFFIMPTLARFELEIHERIERGEALTADIMNDLCADLFEEGYGGELEAERPREGITWATFGHLYSDYYVFQYATGISGAHAISHRILAGEPHAAEDYIGFLKAGGSMYPLDALKQGGVDLATPAAVESTFAVLSGLIDRLEQLVG